MNIRQLSLVMLSLMVGHCFASDGGKNYFEEQYESRRLLFIKNPAETKKVLDITNAVNKVFAKPPRKSLPDGTPTYAKESQIKFIVKLITGSALIHVYGNVRNIAFPECEDNHPDHSHYNALCHIEALVQDLVKHFDLANNIKSIDQMPREIWRNHDSLDYSISSKKGTLLLWFNEALQDHKEGILKRQKSIRTVQAIARGYLARKSYLLLKSKMQRGADSPTSDVTDVSGHTDSSLDLSITVPIIENSKKKSLDTPLSPTMLGDSWEIVAEEENL